MLFGKSAWRSCWLRALAGVCVGAGLAAVSVSTNALAGAQQNYATFSVTPTSVTAGEVTEFTFTVTAQENFKGGVVIVQVPDGWAPPTTTGSADSPGFTSVATQGPQQPNLSTGSMTITVADIALAPGQVLTISYSAAAAQPADQPSETVSFTGTAQQFASSTQQQLVSQVDVTSSVPPQSPSASPTQTPPSSSTPTATPSSSSPAPSRSSSTPLPGPGGSNSHTILFGLVAAFLVGVLVVWLVRRRPVPVTEQRIRATPHAGPPAQVAVRKTSAEPTLTVRIEPHPDAGTTTIEEVSP
jgi:hypothetical protein